MHVLYTMQIPSRLIWVSARSCGQSNLGKGWGRNKHKRRSLFCRSRFKGFMGRYLETNILLTDNSALENILSAERLLDAWLCELWQNLSGSLLSTHCWHTWANRRGGGRKGRRGARQREGQREYVLPYSIALGLIGRALAFFRKETTGKREMQLHPQRNVSNRLQALSPRSLAPL